jgi:hypothetical protein
MGSEKDLIIGKHLNKFGCYEDQEFLSLGQNMLLESHILLDLSNRIELNEERIKNMVHKYKERYQSSIIKAQKPIWGFKEANLIYYINYIEKWFTNIRYIYLKRDPERIAESFLRTFRKSNWIPEFRAKFPLFTWQNKIRLIFRSIYLFIYL